MTDRIGEAATLALRLIVFADGAEEGGLAGYAQRARLVARETLWLAEQLALERDAYRQLHERNDAMLQVLAERVFCPGCASKMRRAAA